MIIVRSPLRITLGGGGSDIPSYYEKYGGCCVAAAIDKYVYVTITRPFFKGIYLKYSELEHVERIEDVKHSRIREALKFYGNGSQIELTSLADIPAGTGLGSSSSFTTALLRALATYYHLDIITEELAQHACEIEMDRLHEPIGKQDQYISAYGGVRALHFRSGTSFVRVEPILHNIISLEENLMLFFTGMTRSASDVLSAKKDRPKDSMGETAKALLEAGKLRDFGNLLTVQWLRKKAEQGIDPKIEEWHAHGLKYGAIGGKLVGAGGGGFLLFYTENRQALRQAMTHAGLEEVRFRFEYEGTKVLVS